ncbi:MAG: serine hydrolase domain-containing protein, partial [Myxococcota bacterium]
MANLQQILSSASLCTVAALGLLFGCRNEASYSNTDPGALYDGGQDFSALDAYLDERLAEGLAGFAMQILDDEGRVVFRRAEGTCQSSRCPGGEPDFSVQLVTSIASSTKWVTSTVVLAALDEGVQAGRWASVAAALDSAVVPELGCSDMTGPVTVITLRQLLSFTSGVIADHECVNTKESLRDCACTILRDSAAAMTSDTSASTRLRNAHPPGTTYKYGGSHLTIAGAWLEQISGEGWQQLFARLMLEPLDVDMQYVRAANLAGSIQTSVADYSRFVDALRADAQGAETRRLLSFEAV